MKTQVSILVKNATLYTRAMSLLWFINIFRKMPVDVRFDSENATPVRLKAQKEPYIFDVAPGEHELYFTDPKSGGKALSRAITGGILGMAVTGATGGSMLAGGAIGADAAYDTAVRDGYAGFTLNEGDLLELWCRPTRKGGVKVRAVKKK